MKNFLAQFKGWAHTFGVLVLTGATIYTTNDAAHKAINQALAGAPRLAAWVGSAVAILLAFANAKKEQS